MQKHPGTLKIPLMPMHMDPNLRRGNTLLLHCKRKSVIGKCNGVGVEESEMELKKKKKQVRLFKRGTLFLLHWSQAPVRQFSFDTQ